MRIDAHCHFWKYDPVTHEWITDELKMLQKDRLPSDLEEHLKAHQIDGVIAVQAPPTEQETIFLLELSERFSFIKGIVGWIDFHAPNFDERLNLFSSYDTLKGFRYLLHDVPIGYLLQSDLIKAVKEIGSHGLTYDVLITEHQLEEAIAFAEKIDCQTKLVVDHMAKPVIRNKSYTDWANNVKKLSKIPEVYMKVSGMVTEADRNTWIQADFEPYLNAVLEYFGPDRMMYGSDWPISCLAADYDQVIGIVANHYQSLSPEEQKKIFGETASSFYGV